MPKEIGWSQEAYLLAQVKALLARVGSMSPVSGGITSLNGLTDATQTFAVGTAGTGLTITSSAGVHTFNIPNASATAKGLLTAVDWSTFSNKLGGTGTTNYVSKFTASGTIGNSQIFDNGTNVGIGTTTPATAAGYTNLTINGTDSWFVLQRSNANTFSLEAQSTASYISTLTSSALIFRTNTTERMRITSGGNVGIGTTNPLSLLEVNSSNVRVRVVGTTGSAVDQFVNSSGQMFVGIDTSTATLFGNGNYSRAIYSGGAYPLDFYTNDVIRARIDASGNVGIGTTSPQVRLTVSNGGVQGLELSPTGGLFGGPFIQAYNRSTSSYLDLTSYASQHIWYTGGGVRSMELTNLGKLLINTITDAGAYALQVAGSVYNTTGAVLAASSGSVGIGTTLTTGKLNFENTTAVVTNGIVFTAANAVGTNHGFSIGLNRQARTQISSSIKFLAANYSSNDDAYLTFSTGSNDVERMRITAAGDVGIGTTSPFSKFTVSAISSASQISIVNTDGGHLILRSGIPGISNNGASFVIANVDGSNQNTRMVISVTGNVGIGNTNPGRTLVVDGQAAGGVLQITNNTAGNASGNGLEIVSAGLDAFISVKNNGYLGIATNNTERIRITSGGDVGIGTTTPTSIGGAKLAVYQLTGTTIIAAKTDDIAGGAGIYLEGSSAANNIIQIRQFSSSASGTISGISLANGSFFYTSSTSAGPLALVQQASQPILFASGGSERMRITAGGNVLIGTTTDAGYRLSVNGSMFVQGSGGIGMFIASGNAIRSDGNLYIDAGTVSGGDLYFRAGTSYVTSIYTSSGNFGLGQTTFGTNATRTFAINTGIAPTTSPVDAIQMYSADVVAGNAAPHFRTENGAVVKVYQETTGVAAATRVGGGGTTVTDTDTFDGYTIAKLVKALRNQGLLA